MAAATIGHASARINGSDTLEAMQHVFVRGVRIPVYDAQRLSMLSSDMLRAHAEYINEAIGPLSTAVPEHDDLIIDWLQGAYREHLEPLLTGPPATTTHAAHAPVPHVSFQGVPIPLYEDHHLRSLPVAVLRAHAEHVTMTIGPSLMSSIPTCDKLLIEWLIETHNTHLHPLRAHAVPHAVPHVYHRGTPIPLYEPHHLESLSHRDLRAHANHFYKTVGEVKEPVPNEDNMLLEWLVEMHGVHLNHHLAQVRRDMCVVDVDPTRANPKTVPMAFMREEAEKLHKLQAMEGEELEKVLNSLADTLLSHGLKATAALLKQEANLSSPASPASRKAGGSPKSPSADGGPVVPVSMDKTVVQNFAQARQLGTRYHHFVEESSEQVEEHRERLQRLVERMGNIRELFQMPSAEEKQAASTIKLQDSQLDAGKQNAEAVEREIVDMRKTFDTMSLSKVDIRETIEAKSQNAELYLSQIGRLERTVEALRRTAHKSDASQAQRIRHQLLQWDTPQGPKRVAAETFAHVDSNHDGRLEYEEVLKFARKLFQQHQITVPAWPESVWFELYRACDLDHTHAIDVVESLRFARGCFEAALRALAGG